MKSDKLFLILIVGLLFLSTVFIDASAKKKDKKIKDHGTGFYKCLIKGMVFYYNEIVDPSCKQLNIELTKWDYMSKLQQYNKLQRIKYDELTWKDITIDDWHYHDKIQFRDVRKIFPSDIIQEIEKAFKEKSKFSYPHYSKNRDYSVNGELGDDGIYRAWFRAEYKGMGNGLYYLLINPHTTVFLEED